MKILAIDPGTNCGWAVHDGREIVAAGTWTLKPRTHEGAGMRFVRLRGCLEQVFAAFPDIGRVVFEEVRRHAGTGAAHIYGGIVATLTEFCESRKVVYGTVSVGEVKKTATGKGNADKDAMKAAALRRWPEFKGDDNEADARWIAETAARAGGGVA